MNVTHPRCRSGAPTLYYDELSPQSRSCYMLIKVLGIEVELKPINLTDAEHLNESYRKINPCTMPILIDGQFIISDGHTIMIYLCDKYAGDYLPHLCPCDYLPRLSVLNMLFYEGCVLYRRYSHLLTEIFLKKYPNVDMCYHLENVIDSYNSLETNLKGKLCMTGNSLTIADLSVITTLSGLDLMFPILQVRWPNLHRWLENLKSMDCYKCNDEGIQKLSYILETEGHVPLPSVLSVEPTSSKRSLLRPSFDIEKEKCNFSNLKVHAELPLYDRSSLSEKEEANYNDRMPTNATLPKYHSPRKTDSTSAQSEGQTDLNYSKFFPKIRTSKIIITPPHADHDSESSFEAEKLCEDKEFRGSEVKRRVEVCQPKVSSGCLCCRRSFILNRSK